jgi:hypothetical protein
MQDAIKMNVGVKYRNVDLIRRRNCQIESHAWHAESMLRALGFQLQPDRFTSAKHSIQREHKAQESG